MEKLSIANVARGALVEQFNIELEKVLENIADPNTDAKKVRKVVITVSIHPNKSRTSAVMNFQTKSNLIPTNAVETDIILDKDNNGKIVAAELRGEVPGQVDMEDCADKKVVNIKK